MSAKNGGYKAPPLPPSHPKIQNWPIHPFLFMSLFPIYLLTISVGVLHIVADYRSKLWQIHGWALCDMEK